MANDVLADALRNPRQKWTVSELADALMAGPQAVASIGSGMVAQPISGLAGLFGLGGGPERAANAVGRVQDMLTYQPTNPYAQRVLSGVSEVTAPIGRAFEALRQKAGDAGYAVGGPLGGAVGAMVPDAAAMVPLGALFRGMRGMPQRFPLPNQSQAGAIVYHGSPHKFDRFDSSKIGTGEGAQAYGHGLYFADNPSVADSYAGMLSPNPKLARNGEALSANSYPEMLADSRAAGAGSIQKAIDRTKERLGSGRANVDDAGRGFDVKQERDTLAALLRLQRKGYEVTQGGNLYKVDLPDSAISNMLDWDKPLSQQPEGVRKALESLNKPFGGFREGPADVAQFNKGIPANEAVKYPDAKGQTIYTDLQQHFGSPQELTDALRKAGVTGIRYLDRGSRGAGQGTSNYVVFSGNENLLKILERQ